MKHELRENVAKLTDEELDELKDHVTGEEEKRTELFLQNFTAETERIMRGGN